MYTNLFLTMITLDVISLHLKTVLRKENSCRTWLLKSYTLKNTNYTYCQLESAPPTTEPQPCTWVPYSSSYTLCCNRSSEGLYVTLVFWCGYLRVHLRCTVLLTFIYIYSIWGMLRYTRVNFSSTCIVTILQHARLV